MNPAFTRLPKGTESHCPCLDRAPSYVGTCCEPCPDQPAIRRHLRTRWTAMLRGLDGAESRLERRLTRPLSWSRILSLLLVLAGTAFVVSLSMALTVMLVL